MEPDPDQLYKYLSRVFPKAKYYSAYEAGFSGFWIDHRLRELGIQNIVVNPVDIPTTQKERKRKTDKRDARKIATMLRGNHLTKIYSPSVSALEDRQLVRSRKQLVKDAKRCKNRIKSTLNLFGIIIPKTYDIGYWSKSFMEWLKQLDCAPSLRNAIDHQIKELEFISAQKKQVDKSIVALSKTERYEDLVVLLRSIQGIGLLGSMTIITELIDINRFKRPDELHAYAGLIPNMHASGNSEQIGQITKRSNAYLRPLLIQCAWIASKRNPDLALVYSNLRGRGMKSNRAIISVAKKLLNRVRYVWKTKQEIKITY